VGCHLRTSRHGFLAFQLRWNGLRSWEGTRLQDTAANRTRLQKVVRLIDAEIKAGSFEYLRFFPNGNKAALFLPPEKEAPSPKTFAEYYAEWIGRQGPPRVKPSTVAFYRYAIRGKVLPGWKNRSLESIVGADLQALQTNLYALGLSAATVNRGSHHGAHREAADGGLRGRL
jgi:integrase